jgi:ribosomal protein S18 acetylase RimI-like enzyme
MAPTTLTPLPTPVSANRFTIRTLGSGDFLDLQRLEQEIWGQDPNGMLGPFYLRLCTEHYADWCFLALEGDRPVGYVLNFPRGKVNYCATLAVHPEFQKSKANYLLIRALVVKLLQEDMDECRFLVEPDNREARSIHESLGAHVVKEVNNYYRMGDTRLWSTITRNDLERIRTRYTKLRLVS